MGNIIVHYGINTIQLCVFKIRYDSYLQYKDTMIEISQLYYNSWKNTELGIWCTENNIEVYTKSEFKDAQRMEYIIPCYVSLTPKQHLRFQEIKFYQKLTT